MCQGVCAPVSGCALGAREAHQACVAAKGGCECTLHVCVHPCALPLGQTCTLILVCVCVRACIHVHSRLGKHTPSCVCVQCVVWTRARLRVSDICAPACEHACVFYTYAGSFMFANMRACVWSCVQDTRIRLMLYDDVLDLSVLSQAPSSKAARELYSTVKYLISEDAANYRWVAMCTAGVCECVDEGVASTRCACICSAVISQGAADYRWVAICAAGVCECVNEGVASARYACICNAVISEGAANFSCARTSSTVACVCT